MKNYKKDEDKAKRMAIKDLNRLSDRIRDKKRIMLRTEQLLKKQEDEIAQLNYKFDEVISIIHGTVSTNSVDVVE